MVWACNEEMGLGRRKSSRPRVRPKKEWLDRAKQDSEMCAIANWPNRAHNREEWKMAKTLGEL